MNSLGTKQVYLLGQEHAQVQAPHCATELSMVETGGGGVGATTALEVQEHVNNQQVGFASSNSGCLMPNQTENQMAQLGHNDPNGYQAKEEPGAGESQQAESGEDAAIDITINNVVSSFSTRCHLNLKKIALEASNVMYRRESGMVSMKIRRPYTTASIWSSGKITCTGATSEVEAKIAARRFARMIQNLGYNVKFVNFRIVNVLGTCSFPFGIRITHFSRDHSEDASYEPELHPGVTYKIKPPDKATLKIFSTGSVTVTAPSVRNVQLAIEHIYPLVYEYRMDLPNSKKVDPTSQGMHLMPKNRIQGHKRPKAAKRAALAESEDESLDETSDDDFDSEESQD